MHFQLWPALALAVIAHAAGYDHGHALFAIFFVPPLNCLLPQLIDFYTIEFFPFSNVAYPIVDASRHNTFYECNNNYAMRNDFKKHLIFSYLKPGTSSLPNSKASAHLETSIAASKAASNVFKCQTFSGCRKPFCLARHNLHTSRSKKKN